MSFVQELLTVVSPVGSERCINNDNMDHGTLWGSDWAPLPPAACRNPSSYIYITSYPSTPHFTPRPPLSNIIRNTERDFRGIFYTPRPLGCTSPYGFGASHRPRCVKNPEGLSRWYFFILSTVPDPLRCLNMSKHVKTIGTN